jgi:hypothetical protein
VFGQSYSEKPTYTKPSSIFTGYVAIASKLPFKFSPVFKKKVFCVMGRPLLLPYAVPRLFLLKVPFPFYANKDFDKRTNAHFLISAILCEIGLPISFGISSAYSYFISKSKSATLVSSSHLSCIGMLAHEVSMDNALSNLVVIVLSVSLEYVYNISPLYGFFD